MSSPDPPAVLYNTVGDTVPVVTDEQGNMRALAPNGRLVVAAGQIIASAWGNTTYDQSMMTFANAADRTNQWPVPNEGSLSFLMDSRTPWIYRQGAWRGLPLGFLSSATGPPNQTDYTGLATVVSVSWTIAPGRQYRVTAYANGTQITAVGGSTAFRLTPPADIYLAWMNSVPVNTVVVGSLAALYTGTIAGTAQVNLVANTTGGALRVAANQASIMVEDIGG